MTAEPTIVIGAGAAKSGTTWLWRYLSGHDACHFRGIKELHYFDTCAQNRFGGALRVARARLARASDERASGDPARRAAMAADLRAWIEVLTRRAYDPAAYLRYLLAGRGGRRLVGEVTPAYALLPVDWLRRIAGVAGDVRIIYVMRDPIARLWSHVRMMAVRAGAADPVAAARVILAQVLDGDRAEPARSIRERGDYAGALARLDAAVDPRRLLVMFFEDMVTPAGVARLSSFLGIRPGAGAVVRAAHVGPEMAMPAALTGRARAVLRPQYAYVADRFPALPRDWRRNMDEGAA